MAALELVSEHACFGGVQRIYSHASTEIGLPMGFSVFLRPQARIDQADGKVPALLYLAGLTCNEETFMTKAGAKRQAAALGQALIAPDTSTLVAHDSSALMAAQTTAPYPAGILID